MATLDVTRNYADQEALLEADLDIIQTDLKTLVNTTGFNADNFQAAGITASTKLADSSILTATLADGSVTTDKIAASAITTAKIADAQITTAKILDSNVTTGKIANSTLTTADFVTGAITAVKREALGGGSGAVSTFTTTSTSEVDMTGLSCNLTTTGKSVCIYLCKSETATGMDLKIDGSSTAPIYIRMYRDATLIGVWTYYKTQTDSSIPYVWVGAAGTIFQIDYNPAAANYTYKLTFQNIAGATASGVESSYLIAYEIV